MGKQIIIIGASGQFDPAHLANIVKLLCEAGLSVQHASTSEGASTSFFTGTHEDLRKDLALLGHKIEVTTEEKTATSGEVPAGVTLETVNANVLQVLTLISMGSTQGKQLGTRSGAKEPKAGKKEGAGAKVPVIEEKPVPEGKPEGELLQEDPAGKSAQGDGAGAGDEKSAEGDDAADGQQGHEQEVGGTAETTTPTEEGEG